MAVLRRFQKAGPLAAAIVFSGSVVAAEGPKKSESPYKAESAKKGEKADEPPAEEKPPVRLDVLITEHGPERPWELRIKNASDEPIRVAADPRLVSFVVKVPEAPPSEEPEKKSKKKKWQKPKKPPEPVECKLPEKMLPPKPVDEAIAVLGPGKQVVRTFDPRFFCFSSGPQEALVPGAELTPTFGWPVPTKTKWKKGKKVEEPLPVTGPWVAEPAQEESKYGPLKNAPVAPLTLGPDYQPWAKPEDEESKEPLALRISKGVDATDERGVVATVVLKNQSKERQRVFFRRELITFEVLGPEGLAECQAGPDERNPATAGAFTSLGSGSTESLTSRVVELCERGTFARPGLYLVGARYEAKVDGSQFGIDTFTGTVRTERPVSVRVRTGEQPFLVMPQPKPEDEIPVDVIDGSVAPTAPGGAKPGADGVKGAPPPGSKPPPPKRRGGPGPDHDPDSRPPSPRSKGRSVLPPDPPSHPPRPPRDSQG